MSRMSYFTLYILQYIFFTNGQNVQPMPPHDSCVPGSTTLRCPTNYVIVVKSASYGVAQIPGSCTYTPGDCIADAMSIVSCLTDSIQCNLYAVKKRIPQCNDRSNDYVHIEYDCVPISMDDSTKEYNVYQNGTEITSDHGIIKSPGYPTQFQTTASECFRFIHVPNDKRIRLWLTDLYISSSGTNCAEDHVFVDDSVQTYRHCGSKRIAFPTLCSSTIIIQYMASLGLSSYRGMRMYFDVIDRLANDNCPSQNVTVTSAPAINPNLITSTPIYATLGIASPVRIFQICKGESYTIECPNDYAIAVTTNIFGVTQSDQCEQHDASKHCIITTEPTFACRQSCTYLYSGNRVVPSCGNKIAAYQYVQYQCIPTKTAIVSPNTSCPNNGSKMSIEIDRNGRFQSYNYPNLKKMNCTYRLKTKSGDIMHIYSLDISLNDYSSDCKSNKISFIEDGENQGPEFCEQRTFALIYSSCSNELDLHYTIDNEAQLFSSGVELYIESQARPLDWACGKPLPTTIRTTPFTTATSITSNSFMSALTEAVYDICLGSSLTYSCPTGFTFMIISGYYGVKKEVSNKCGFVQGDCVQEAASTITQCQNDVSACYLTYLTKRRLAHCSDNYADYLHITYQCVPSKPVGIESSLNIYDICETNNPIADFNGIITSPSFPNYKQTTNECKRTIVGVQDRVLKIWINEMAVSSGDQRSLTGDSDEPDVIIYKNHDTDDLERMNPSIRDTCVKDYLIINAPHAAYIYCGSRKLAMTPICATNVTIQYKTTSSPNIIYKGFKFYFEWMEKPTDTFCDVSPDNISTTTPINEPFPIWAQNLEVSPILSLHVCLGASITLRCPRSTDYVLSIIDSQYGVTGTGLCEVPSFNHCHQQASLNLTCAQSCFVEYILPKPLAECESQNADYLSIDYECIPTRLPNNENSMDICSSTTTDTIVIDSGMIISPQYPTLSAARMCSKRIETLPNKLWMIFLVDLFLEGKNDFGACNASSLTIYDGKDKVIRCGLHQPELVLISCSNIVEFSFISTYQGLGYRGFKVYFKAIDAPDNWMCAPSGLTTTTRPPSTTTLIPPSLQIATYGGTTTNGTRQYCTFPFIYQGDHYTNCIANNPPSSTPLQNKTEPWCSLTTNFDTDQQWGFCNIGVTDSTLYDICRSQSQILRCPSGYVIDIIAADYAAKPNGNISASACVYDKNDCFQSDSSTLQNVCAGKPSCTVLHFTNTLVSCQNRPSAYFHIDYTCIPNDIPDINTYNMCNNNSVFQGDVRRGFIISPNYPNTQNNIDCTFNLQTIKPHQDIHLYILDMDLNNPNQLGQSCSKDRLIVRADNGERELCGRSYTDFLLKTCRDSASLQLIRASDAIGRGVKFYFEFRERPSNEYCEPLLSTTSHPTALTTTTTTGSRPVYFPDPSPQILKTLCYPDLSGLFGENNFQCPEDYVIVIRRAFYGKGSRCSYSSGDCTDEADIVYQTCSGKQTCSISFINQVTLPTCNNSVANYLSAEYQCLPTPTIAQNIDDLCTVQLNQISGMSGILKSPSYPSYTQTDCANVTLSTRNNINEYIYLYILDLNIDEVDVATSECKNDYISISYQCDGRHYVQRLCGTRKTEFVLGTCSPTDGIIISYRLLSERQDSFRGFAFVYQFLIQSEMSSTTTLRIPTTTLNTTITSASTPARNETTLSPITSSVSTNAILSSTSSNASIISPVSTTTTLSSTSSSSTISTTTTPSTSTQSIATINYDLKHVLMILCTVIATLIFEH